MVESWCHLRRHARFRKGQNIDSKMTNLQCRAEKESTVAFAALVKMTETLLQKEFKNADPK